jgi:dTDP-4-dehydrorhamnose reductase
MIVIVFGANGQLGQAIQSISTNFSNIHFKKNTDNIQFHFFDSNQVDITNINAVEFTFKLVKPDFCINAAAYTAVDKAEIEEEKAHLINVIGVKNIIQSCLTYDTSLIHISTDFVFDGIKTIPYLETDPTNPQGVYGVTKRKGELEIIQSLKKYFIVRTSWLYSDFGNNFKKTMLKLANEKDQLSVVNDQRGSPTHALDLADMILKILISESKNYGIYHFCNEGNTSWFEFAKKIFELNSVKIDLKAIPTSEYPTLALRPKYSVLDTSKIKKEFNINIKSWENALRDN